MNPTSSTDVQHRDSLLLKIEEASALLAKAESTLRADELSRETLLQVKQFLYDSHMLSSSFSSDLRPLNKIVFALKPGERVAV